MIMERSKPVFRAMPNLYWIAGMCLAFSLGLACANGFATHKALTAAKGDCHYQLRIEKYHLLGTTAPQ